MNKQTALRSLVLIDDANFYYGSLKQNWELDYEKFYSWLKSSFNPIGIHYFGGIITKKAFFYKNPDSTVHNFYNARERRKKFFRKLRKIGYHLTTKPLACVYDNTAGDYRLKCNFDVEIAIKAMDLLSSYDELVLCSGDGDFEKLIRYVKGKYKKTVVITFKDRANNRLLKASNRSVYMDSLKEKLRR